MSAETIRLAVAQMSPAQFNAYEQTIRSQPYDSYTQNPDLLTALQAVNERRAAEGRTSLNVTVRDGAKSGAGFTWGGINWLPLAAVAGVLLIASRL